MTTREVESGVESYVTRLELELGKRFVTDPSIIDEVRDHLADAVERGLQQGCSATVAEGEAIERFGTPETVARAFAADRFRTVHRCLLVSAIAIGIGIAYVDAQPSWDDAGITAGAMMLVAGLLALAGPRRAWAWALAVGIWIPAYSLVRAPSLGTVAMLLVLVFPFAGAYLGVGLRRAAMRAST
jgi:hypothetical protein